MLKAYNTGFAGLQTPRLRRVRSKTSCFVPAYSSPRVIINVSGMRYETYEETLESYPETLLGSPTRRSEYYNATRDEYVFARDKPSFDAILFFYQSRGILAKPHDVSEETFLAEMEFYGLRSKYYADSVDHLSASQEDVETEILPESPHKRKLWLWFEYPRSSQAARRLAIWSIFVIVFSTIIFCIETLPALQIRKSFVSDKYNMPITQHSPVANDPGQLDYWFIMEAIFVAWFTFEYFVRLYSAPSLLNFVKSTMGILDVLAIFPFYLTLALRGSTNEVRSFAVIRAIRLFRVLRVFKLSRYSNAIKLLVNTVYSSLEQLKSLGLCFMVAVVIFSSAIFYAEENSNFPSIPDSFWWTVITMTSVGYGDMTPTTPVGKFVGSFCAMSGVVFFCLPTPVLVSNFIKFYANYGNFSEKKKAFVDNLKELFLNRNQ
ncbi:potassium voltage-gated channel protein Shaker-like [Montipora foliosa]|uniref:potassium voltage-gated channel protein Shaker-like n=1 Tax=Montipora foliosa TaxID=591990 RepID=UPI0035F1DCE3